MWKPLAFLVTCAIVAASIAIENPEVIIPKIEEKLNQVYHQTVSETNWTLDKIAAVSSPFISATIWIGLYCYFRPKRQTKQQETEPKNEVHTALKKAEAQLLYNQLKQQLVILQGRQKWIPEQVIEAEQLVKDKRLIFQKAQNNLLIATKEVEQAKYDHDKLINEMEKQDDEIASIENELERLSKLI